MRISVGWVSQKYGLTKTLAKRPPLFMRRQHDPLDLMYKYNMQEAQKEQKRMKY